MFRCPSALAVAILASAPFAGAALAQSSAAGLVEVDDDSAMVTAYGITADELDDFDVFGENGGRLGEVEDVLADASGQITAVAVEFDAFPSLDDREVVVRLDQLTLDGGRLVTSLTESQASALPGWDD